MPSSEPANTPEQIHHGTTATTQPEHIYSNWAIHFPCPNWLYRYRRTTAFTIPCTWQNLTRIGSKSGFAG